jgi:hypothetical protein
MSGRSRSTNSPKILIAETLHADHIQESQYAAFIRKDLSTIVIHRPPSGKVVPEPSAHFLNRPRMSPLLTDNHAPPPTTAIRTALTNPVGSFSTSRQMKGDGPSRFSRPKWLRSLFEYWQRWNEVI